MELDERGYWDLAVRRSVSRFFLLAALAQRPMHGYELAQEVAVASGNCCAPSDAALYPAIRELSEGGYIVCEEQHLGGRRRNVCTLTERGRDALAAAAESWGEVLPYLGTIIEGGMDGGRAATPATPAPPATTATTTSTASEVRA